MHPRCGELAELLRRHGPDAAWIELADGYVTIVPRGWQHAWAKDQKIGGVGVYLGSGFVHMDTGPIRFWSGE